MHADDSGHRRLEADQRMVLEVWAPTEPALLREAGIALIDLLTDELDVKPAAQAELALFGIDRADRLAQWLGELAALATVDGFLMADADVTLDGDGGLSATLRGEEDSLEDIVVDLGGARPHEVELGQRNQGWFARISLMR